jgi:nucleoside-diphosphate-sugar epimerase
MVLITGGTGAIGGTLVEKLLLDGQAVRVLTLPADPAIPRLEDRGVDVRVGDIRYPEQICGICEGVSTVIHLAAIIIAPNHFLYRSINVKGTEAILKEARKSDVRHFVYVSSASVTYTKPTAYSLSKKDAEYLVQHSGVPWTIVRPTLVYGKKGGMEFDMFLSYLRTFPIVPFIGKGDALKRPVYVDDVVEGLFFLTKRENGKGAIYNFSGGKAISMSNFVRLCLIAMGQEKKPVIHIPVEICISIASVLERLTANPPLRWSVIAGITQDANLDPSDAMRDLGYAPSSVAEMLPSCFPRA